MAQQEKGIVASEVEGLLIRTPEAPRSDRKRGKTDLIEKSDRTLNLESKGLQVGVFIQSTLL
jgi:hypothetical protein